MADHKHPYYPGTAQIILIGDTAHDGRDQRTGTVGTVWDDNKVTLRYSATFSRHVEVEWLCIGPAPELIELTIRPTREELREWVLVHDRQNTSELNTSPARKLIIDAIPADLLAELRAEIAEGRQS